MTGNDGVKKKSRRGFSFKWLLGIYLVGIVVVFVFVSPKWTKYKQRMTKKHNSRARQFFGYGATDKDLIKLKKLTYITKLVLWNPKINDAGLVHLKSLPNLTSLYLYGAKISDAGLVHLKSFPNLTSLCLYSAKISNAGLVHLKSLTNLTALGLSGKKISNEGLIHLKSLNLTWLCLIGKKISEIVA